MKKRNNFEIGYKRKFNLLVKSLKAQGFSANHIPATEERFDIVGKSSKTVDANIQEKRTKARESWQKNKNRLGRCRETECDFQGTKIEFGRHKSSTKHRYFSVLNPKRKAKKIEVKEPSKSSPFHFLGGENKEN